MRKRENQTVGDAAASGPLGEGQHPNVASAQDLAWAEEARKRTEEEGAATALQNAEAKKGADLERWRSDESRVAACHPRAAEGSRGGVTAGL